MCDPVTITIAVMTVMQGYAKKQEGKYKNDLSKVDARISTNEAQRLRTIGTDEENQRRRATAELEARQRAQLGARNVELGSGSAFNLQYDTRVQGELDARRIRSNTDTAFQSKIDQARYQREAGKAAKKAGDNAFTASLITAAAGLGAEGVSSKWFSADSAAAVDKAAMGQFPGTATRSYSTSSPLAQPTGQFANFA